MQRPEQLRDQGIPAREQGLGATGRPGAALGQRVRIGSQPGLAKGSRRFRPGSQWARDATGGIAVHQTDTEDMVEG